MPVRAWGSTDVVSNYYINPRPEKLLSILKAFLTLEDIITDSRRFGPLAHLMACVAQNDRSFYNNLNQLKDSYQDPQKKVIQSILEESSSLSSPNPDSPKNLDYLWAEFIATGNLEPVRKIISVLDNSATQEKMMLIGAAQWSLASNARQHIKIHDLIKQELPSSKGEMKERLKKILSDIENEKKEIP